MNQHPYLAIGQEVIFVGADDETHKGKITKVYGDHSAHVEWNGGSGIGDCSDKKQPGTFHFEQASPKEEHKKPEAHNKKE